MGGGDEGGVDREAGGIAARSLWGCQYGPGGVGGSLRVVLCKCGPQYEGHAQHDAQEFLMWLLDKVHEDVNVAVKKKYRGAKVSDYLCIYQFNFTFSMLAQFSCSCE